jgi:hypothetical protein
VRDASVLAEGDALTSRFSKGWATSEVTKHGA